MSVGYDKRLGYWRFKFQIEGQWNRGPCLDKDGNKITTNTATGKRAARDYEGTIRTETRKQAEDHAATGGVEIPILATIIDELRTAEWQRQASWVNRIRYVREIKEFFGETTPITEFTDERVDDYKRHTQTRQIMKWTGGPTFDRDDAKHAKLWKPTGKTRSNETSNLYLGTLRAIIEHAARKRNPKTKQRFLLDVPKVPELPTVLREPNPVPWEMVKAAMAAATDDRVRDTIEIAGATGMRRDEILNLTVSHVDFERCGIRLKPHEVKNRKGDFIRGGAIIETLTRLVAQAKERKTPWLLARKVKVGNEIKWVPIKNMRRAWATALRRAGATEHFRLHDLKASFVSKGLETESTYTMQQLARHKDPATTMRYAKARDEVLRRASLATALRPVTPPTPPAAPASVAPPAPAASPPVTRRVFRVVAGGRS